jgi:exosortase A-associated hydrolase 2
MDFAANSGDAIKRLICWQPVLNGDVFVTQFLRLRVAAAMMNSSAPQEKTSDLRTQLLEGQFVEVAGYQLNPDLVRPILALRADQLHLQNLEDVAIFEIVLNVAVPVSASHAQWLAKLHQDGINASLTKVVGDPFWATQEISVAPELIRQTCEQVKTWF